MKRNVNNFDRRLSGQGWLKTDQVAIYLGTSPNNIRNMVYRLKLFPRKFMGRWYFNREEIDQLIMAGV